MPAPIAGRRGPRQRLDTIKATGLPPTQQSTPQETPPPEPVTTAAGCGCSAPDYDPYADDPDVCMNCGGRRAPEKSSLQAELTWGETGAGAAMVVGGLIADDQRHANTMGGTMRGLGGMESREKTLYKGKDEIAKLCAALRIQDSVQEQAVRLYRLALNHNFVQGRRIRNVAACCIYLADRKQAKSTLFLIDLAEKIRVNIWTLGDTYKQFLAITYNEDPSNMSNDVNRLPQLEELVLKYCRRLEFDFDSPKVAADACKLISRMRRDWIVDGRQPAGIIGAAIILAARMNNFRRTVREVVYCVKVADSTIHHRLHEFRRTKAAGLSVKDMREKGHLVKPEAQPPAIYKRQEREERKRKRLMRMVEEEDVTSDTDALASPGAAQTTRPAKQRRTADASPPVTDAGEQSDPITTADTDMMSSLEYVVGAVGAEELGQMPIPKKRGRPRKKREPIVIAPEDLEIEAEIQNEVEQTVEDWQHIFKEFDTNANHPALRAANDVADALARQHRLEDERLNQVEVEEEEFLDDEDVMNCLNTPEEVALKEKIWTTENEDWLRDQQAKLLAKDLEEASGKPKKVKKPRKRNVMGDGSVLDGQPAASAADAVQKMLAKRMNFSSHIDYEVLQGLLGPAESSVAENSAVASREASTTPAANPGAAAPNRAADAAEVVEDIEDYDDEYDEQTQAYDDEDLENEHMYQDDDEGFEQYDDDF